MPLGTIASARAPDDWGTRVILRVFRVWVHPGKHAAYERFLREEGIPATRSQPGALGLQVGGPCVGAQESPDYVFVSLWRDRAALSSMRGDDLDDPGIEPHEHEVIRRAEVEHFHAWGDTTKPFPTTKGTDD